MKFTKIWRIGLLSITAGIIVYGFASAETKSSEILKAKVSITKGQPLSKEMFETVDTNKAEGWMLGKEAKLEGLTAKHDIAAGEYLSKPAVFKGKTITFAKNEREYTVETDLSRCVGGDLVKGDLADVLFFDKETSKAQSVFTVTVLELKNRAGTSLHSENKEVRDFVPATVKIKVTAEQAAVLLTFEQRGLVAFAKIPEEALGQVKSP